MRCIKLGADEYAKRSHLQFFYMDRHEKVADGVYRTTYSNGQSVVVNYNGKSVEVDGVSIPPLGIEVVSR